MADFENRQEKRQQNNAETSANNDRGDRNQRKRNNFRRGGRNRNRNNRFNPDLQPENIQVCPLCGQNVKEIVSAISIDAEGGQAHFDCVIKKITAEEDVKNKEKVVYLGKGEFGIIRYKNDGNKFEILKRIAFENPELAPEWRKNLSKNIRK